MEHSLQDVCAVVITYNIGKDIYKCINSVKNQVNKVVIVDNGSDESTINELKKLEKEGITKNFYIKENKGIAYALNVGAKYAALEGYYWVLTLDHDSEATPGMVNILLNTYNELPANDKDKIAMIAARPVDKTLDINEDLKFQNDYIKEVISPITSGNLVKAAIYSKVGYYDEKLFIDCIDHDFNLRIKKNGYKIIENSNAVLKHKIGEPEYFKILGTKILYTNHSYVRRYYMARNKLYVWKNYYKVAPRWIIGNIIYFIKDTIKVVLFEKQKLVKLKMISKGLHHGITNKFGKLKTN